MSFSEAKWLLEQIKSSLNNNSSGFQQVIKDYTYSSASSEIYDFSKYTPTLPYNFHLGSAVVYNNEIHILGSNNSDYYTKHYKYNGSTNKWIKVVYISDRCKYILLLKDTYISMNKFSGASSASIVQSLNQDSTEVISDTVLKTTKDCNFIYPDDMITMITIYK